MPSDRGSESLCGHLFAVGNFRSDDVFAGMRIAGSRSVPDAATEGRHVNHGGILRVEYHAMSPLEIEAANAFPVLARSVERQADDSKPHA